MSACVAGIPSQPRAMRNGRKMQVIVRNRHTRTRHSSSLHKQLQGLRVPIQRIHHFSTLHSQPHRLKERPPLTLRTSSPKTRLPSRRDHKARIRYTTLTNSNHLQRRNLKAPVLDLLLISPSVTRLRLSIQLMRSSLRRQRRSRHRHMFRIITLGSRTPSLCIRDRCPTHKMEDTTTSHKRRNPARKKQISARANQRRLLHIRARSANPNPYNRISNRTCNRLRKACSSKVKLLFQTPRTDSAWPHNPKSTVHRLMDSGHRLWHPQRRRESPNTLTRSFHQAAVDRAPASGLTAKSSTRSTLLNRCIVGCGPTARDRISLRSRPRTGQWQTNTMLRV